MFENSLEQSDNKYIMMQQGERKIDVVEGESPLIFKCGACGVILGDSCAWVQANENLRSVSLSRVTDVVKTGRNLVSSTEDGDLGSCTCEKDVGRMYHCTARDMDDLRDLYTLDVDKVETYQVGSGSQMATGEVANALGGNTVFAKLKQISDILVAYNQRFLAMEKKFSELDKKNSERISAMERKFSELQQLLPTENVADDSLNQSSILRSVIKDSSKDLILCMPEKNDVSQMKRKSSTTISATASPRINPAKRGKLN